MPRIKKRDQDGIFRRPDSPHWWACTPNGRGGSTRRSTGIKVADDPHGLKAAAIRAAWLADTPTPAPQPLIAQTFDDLMLAYLARPMNPRTARRRKCAAKNLYPHFTGRSMAGLVGQDVRAFIAARQQQRVGHATINSELQLMSVAINWATIELEWDLPNPFRGRYLPPVEPRVRVLTYQEAAALIDAAEGRANRLPWLADMIRLCLHTGLRPSEATGLTWDRVDLHARRISFGPGDQKNGKPGAVPLNETARGALVSRARFRATHCPDAAHVFCRTDGSRIHRFNSELATLARCVGLEDLHPHDLRRTCGSWLIQSGVPIERISKLLRHSSSLITERVYAHLRPQDVADAAAILDTIGTGFHAGLSRHREALLNS